MNCKNLNVPILLISLFIVLQGCKTLSKKYDEGVAAAKEAYSTVSHHNNGKSDNKSNPTTSAKTATSNTNKKTTNKSIAKTNTDVTNILSRPENWHKRPPYFKNLKFDSGEYKIFKAPSSNFTDLYIPMHKGLPRTGNTPSFGMANASQVQAYNDPDRYYKKAFTQRLEINIFSYLILNSLAVNNKLVTSKNLKIDKSGKPSNRNKRPRDVFNHKGFVPRFDIESIAAKVISPELYKYYFCVDGKTCAEYSSQRNGRGWGGVTADEFTSRKKYHSYVDKVVPEILKWGKALSNEVYIVESVRLGDYDFGKKAFRLAILPTRDTSLSHYKTKNNLFKGYKKGIYYTYFPMPQDKAEAFQKRLKKSNTGVIFSTLKVRVTGFNLPSYKTKNSYKLNKFKVELVDNKIEFYFDEQLTEKIFETNKLN